MILVDTSVWIDHLRQGDAELADALQQGRAAIHPFVVGELACGNLRARAEVLGLLQALPSLPVATAEEVLYFIEAHALMGRGIPCPPRDTLQAKLHQSIAIARQKLQHDADQ